MCVCERRAVVVRLRGAVTPEPVAGRHWKSQDHRPVSSRIIYAVRTVGVAPVSTF